MGLWLRFRFLVYRHTLTKIKFISFVIFLLLAISCGKKTQVKGVVYSKNNIPVPNAEVQYRYYKSSNYPYLGGLMKTNNNGEFDFEFKPKNRRSYELHCGSDSGNASTWIEIGKANNIDLHLK